MLRVVRPRVSPHHVVVAPDLRFCTPLVLVATAALNLCPDRAAASPQRPPPASLPTEAAEATRSPQTIQPPRIDGTHIGGTAGIGATVAGVSDLDTPAVFVGRAGGFSIGQTVLPWLGLGFHVSAGGGESGKQRLRFGGLRVDVDLKPLPTRNMLVKFGFGFGAGAVREDHIDGRFGFGGTQLHAAFRYEFFPWASRRRSQRGGGLALGPELGWIGHPPTSLGGPTANSLYLSLASTFYFGH
ncbi:MAG: hypothetical protein V3V08_12070 [Nannocystaceae bacterium]